MADTAPALASGTLSPEAPRTSETRPVLLLILMVLLVTALLATIGIYWKKSTIETALSQQTRQAFMEAGLPLNTIRFDGRDGILSGSAPSKAIAQKSATVARAVEGVRSIDNRLIIKEPQTATAAIPAQRSTPEGEHPLETMDLSQVQFVYAKADLIEDAYPVLDAVHKQLKTQSTVHVMIGVHTDNTGTAIGNMAISQIRAESIMQYLISHGIAAERLQAKGYGATRPLADNTTEEGRSRNRRVTLHVLSE